MILLKWYKEIIIIAIVDEVDSILIDESRTPLIYLEEVKIKVIIIYYLINL